MALNLLFREIVTVEGWPSGQRHQTVNLTTNVYAGSNPAPSTSFRCFAATANQQLTSLLFLAIYGQEITCQDHPSLFSR